MRALFSSLRSIAPFLFGERPALAISRSLQAINKNPPAAQQLSSEAHQSRLLIEGEHGELDLRGVQISASEFSGAKLSQCCMENSYLSRCHLKESQLQDLKAASSSWTLLDMEGARLGKVDLGRSHLSLLSMRDCTFEDCDLAESRLSVCDLSGSKLTCVNLENARLEGCDFTGAVLEEVNLQNADLRSSIFTEAWFQNTEIEGALVDGADFRRVGGLSSAQRDVLRNGGARLNAGLMYGIWSRLLRSSTGAQPHRRVLRAVAISWAVIAFLIPSLFFLRAILDPIDPEAPPSYELE